MMMSLDGYIEARDPGYFWHNWNPEMDDYMMDFFTTVDTFIYGRKSYEDMLNYWPPLDDPFARIMNDTKKLVFSRTLDKVEWNSSLIRDSVVETMRSLKEKPGKNMVLFAGPDLAETFIRHNLVDEFRIIINPVVLGGGKPLFKNVAAPFSLQLTETRHFNCGNVLHVYKPLPTPHP
jgi:dihydrofolate reductase